MQQLQLTAHGDPTTTGGVSADLDFIRLATVPAPQTLASDHVLLRMEAAPINPSDFRLVRGNYGYQPTFPFALGSEGVGRVIATGAGVEAGLHGARVLVLPTYESGTWADEVVVAARNVVPVSADADPLQLSMIGINPATAYLLLRNYATLMPGDWIGQTAANAAMGQYIIQLARLAGLKTLNVVRREEAAEQVRQFGGDRVVIDDGGNLACRIEQALGGQKLSLVLDTVGGPTVGELTKSLKNGGDIVSYALQSGQFPQVSPHDLLFRNLSLHGFWLIDWLRSAGRYEVVEMYQKLAGLVVDGSLSATVEATYPLADYRQAVAHALKPNRSGKIIFRF